MRVPFRRGTPKKILGLFMIAVGLASTEACAQPEQRLAEAIERLVTAGNYTWRETRTMEGPDTQVFPYAFGRTSVGGLSLATLARHNNARAAFRNRETAIQIGRQWRRMDSLSNEEIRQALGVPFIGGNLFDIIRATQHTCHHEILHVIREIGVNVREENGAIVGDLGRGGLAEAAVETLIRRGVFTPPNQGTRPPPGTRAEFRVTLDGADISRLTIDLVRPAKHLRGPKAGEPYLWRRTYVTDISEIGRSEVSVIPELRGLFRAVAPAP